MDYKKVVHITTVHPRYDTRIFIKQARSLADVGYNVSLIVADGLGDELVSTVSIIDIGKAAGRLNRIFRKASQAYNKALSLDADIYHIHDPELIPVGLKLKRQGKSVIFDAHEDLPKQILAKPYLNRVTKYILSLLVSHYEIWACRKFDVVIAATPHIKEKFLSKGVYSIDVNNYPVIEEFVSSEKDWSKKSINVCYIGALSTLRGAQQNVKAMEYVVSSASLVIGGRFNEAGLEAKLKQYKGWRHVDFQGWLDRQQVAKIMSESMAGIVTLHGTESYAVSLPVKMFEYMSAGIPVIASNFPLWEGIIKDADCGVCVDPMNVKSIAEAIDFMLLHPERAKVMGQNGMKAVRKKYNWSIEQKKLIGLYSDLLSY